MLDYRFQPRQKFQKKGDKNNNKHTNRSKGRQFKYETKTRKHKEWNQGKI